MKRRLLVVAFVLAGLLAVGVPASRLVHVTKLTVRGRVLDARGAPVGGALVALVRAEGPRGPSSVLALVTANEHGLFSATAEATSSAATVTSVRALRESGEGFGAVLLDEKKRSRVGTLEAGDLRFEEARGFLLRVRVTAEGRPLPRAVVGIARRRAIPEAEPWRTNAEGVLEVVVAESAQVVLLREESFVAESVALPREPGRHAAATLVALPRSPLTGLVKDEDVGPLRSATVLLHEAGSDRLLDRATSDERGAFVFSNALPGRRYRLELESGTLAPDRTERLAHLVEVSHPGQVPILVASRAAFIRLDRARWAILERALPSSEYRPELLVEVVPHELAVPPGDWRVLWADPDGGLHVGMCHLAGGDRKSVRAEPAREVAMRVVGLDGAPVPAVTPVLVRGRFRSEVFAYPAGDGVLRFHEAPRREFSVALCKTGWKERVIRVEAGETSLDLGDVVLEKE